jgi:hypothetical protein
MREALAGRWPRPAVLVFRPALIVFLKVWVISNYLRACAVP